MQALVYTLPVSQRTSLLALFLLGGWLLPTLSANAFTQQTSPANQAPANSSASLPASKNETSALPHKSSKQVQTNAVDAVATVKDNIAVEAGLLTHDSVKDLFGGWVANNYAVVQVTIGNQSRNQQFVLQDIFFDYSNWALSGLYNNGATEERHQKGLNNYQSATNAGQISSIGAFEIHDAFKSNSVFTPRNSVVNALVLVGTAAGAYSILGPLGFQHAVTGFTSDVIPGVQKFWPDRSIDQQSNLLKYGYQDKLVVGKEEPAKTYAFFPIDRFLTNGLGDLFKKQPAVFFNPAELFLDPKLSTIDEHSCGHFHSGDCKALLTLKNTLTDLLKAQMPGVADAKLKSQAFQDLVSPCYNGRGSEPGIEKSNQTGTFKVEEADCPYLAGSSDAQLKEIRNVKRTLEAASLNSVRIVVSGIMTVDVQTVPPTIANVKFDKESEGASLWKNSTDKETGVIEGKFLTDGTPKITGILPPTTASKPDPTDKDKNPKDEKPAAPAVDDYIVKDSLKAVKDGSSDTELHFALQFTKKTLPNGTKISFQVEKSTKSGNSNSSTTAETVTSMTYTYTVAYTPTEPTITGVTFADENAVDWAKSTADLSGIITGKNLTGATPSVSKITLADKSPATVSTYVTDKDLSVDTKTSTDTILNFTFKPTKVIPPGTELTFEVSTKDKDGTVNKAEAEKPYTTPEAAAKQPQSRRQRKIQKHSKETLQQSPQQSKP